MSTRHLLASMLLIFATGTVLRADQSLVLRLTQWWKWQAKADTAKSPGDVDLNAASRPDQAPRTGKIVLSREFRVPEHWRGRAIWLTYDAPAFSNAGIRQIRLNDRPLRLAMSAKSPGGIASQSASHGNWFVDVASLCRDAEVNRLSIQCDRWPSQPNMGVWLYSPPERESVLFLMSAPPDRGVEALVRSYAECVERTFPVKAIVQTRTFARPEDVRWHLQEAHRTLGIGGAVLVGSFPLLTEDGRAVPRYFESPSQLAPEQRQEMCIWTSYIRPAPGIDGSIAGFLRKAIAYLQGRSLHPNTGAILPNARGNTQLMAGFSGVDHFDSLAKPSDFLFYTAHAGVAHGGCGPHNIVTNEEAMNTYPGALIVKLYGCSAGNIASPGLTPAEALLHGRSLTQVVITHAMPQGGAVHAVPMGAYEELLRISPHMGFAYRYYYDLRGQYPYSLIMLGNPFVKVGGIPNAPSGSVQGTARVAGRIPVGGLYVSVTRGKEFWGRGKTQSDGRFELSCLPAGMYELNLHINAVEVRSRPVQVTALRPAQADWDLGQVWTLRVDLTTPADELSTPPWLEVAGSRNAKAFLECDLLAARGNGTFQLIGTRPQALWIRARAGHKTSSTPMRIVPPKLGSTLAVSLDLPPDKPKSR